MRLLAISVQFRNDTGAKRRKGRKFRISIGYHNILGIIIIF
jgi:hypothetical protein